MTAPEQTSSSVVIPQWDFADRLRKVRRTVACVDQGAFAATLDVGAQAYAAWEAGRTQPRDAVAIAKRIELATGVPASWTLGLDDPPPPRRDPSSTGVDGSQLRIGRERVNGGGVVLRALLDASPSIDREPAAAQLEGDDAVACDRPGAPSPFAPGLPPQLLTTAVPA